jgi:hypothetical protein
VPGDLLRYVDGPTAYSTWWLWIALALLAAAIAWYAGVVIWTLPSQRLRRTPLVRTVHARLIRRRFARSIRTIGDRYRTGQLPAAQACAQMSRTLRSFLHQVTGTRAQYMHVGDIAASSLAPAAPMFAVLNDAQFSTAPQTDVNRLAAEAEELILTWT